MNTGLNQYREEIGIGVFLVIAIGLCALLFAQDLKRTEVKPYQPTSYAKPAPCEYIHNAALAYGVPESMMVSLVNVETPDWDINSRDTNPNGSIDCGLFKFNSRYHKWFADNFGLTDPHNPENAAYTAAKYLTWLKDKTGSWEGAVTAWNCGLTRWKTGSIPESTQRHAARVLAHCVI